MPFLSIGWLVFAKRLMGQTGICSAATHLAKATAGRGDRIFGWALRIAALALLAAGFSALCQAPLETIPPELTFLKSFDQFRNRYAYEAWASVNFHIGKKSGHHWNMLAAVPGPKPGDDAGVLTPVTASALKAGWTIAWDDVKQSGVIEFHYQKNGVEAWALAYADFAGSVPTVHWEMIEVVPPPISVTLVPPSATREAMPTGNTGDIPFLTPIPNSKFDTGKQFDTPFIVNWKKSGDAIVANGSIARYYRYPDLSDLLLGTVYHDALIKAGWDVDQPALDNPIYAHYTKNGRNIWAYVDFGGTSYVLQVGNEGAPNQLSQSLAADCHVAIYGVLFDFNKSTLQPASDGPLQQVAALMKAKPTLKIEVQGHTDNVGGDAYNQTLSEARAHSVMAWLTAHGVAASRMTAKGYGKTMPVADNNTDEGRAKNRRVEIADPNCKRH
jgi:outer membrane protein OmpA-like peptidoglycan-associated protein